MNPKFNRRFIVLALHAGVHQTMAQGTAFTYQGQLNTNSVAYSGSAEFQFTLWDAASGGNSVATNNPASVIATVANGLFTVTLDFGINPFNGQPRFLQTDVRTVIGPFTTLTPRQPLTATPYALRALNLTTNGLAAGNYGNAVSFDNAANSFTGTFSGTTSGDGTGLTNVNAATLGGLGSSNFWKIGGNAGANPLTGAFLGTTDNLPLELRVNNQRVLRLEPEVQSQATIIAGSPFNNVNSSTVGATIGGGGATNSLQTMYSFLSGLTISLTAIPPAGSSNHIASDFGTIAGGVGNFIDFESENAVISGGIGNQIGQYAGGAVIAGGALNQIQASNSVVSVISGGVSNTIGSGVDYSVIAGGQQNTVQARVSSSTIGGGLLNSTTGDFATVPGGDKNSATNHAFAAGHRAKADDTGSFVWADSTEADFASTAANQFLIRAGGGVGIGTASPSRELEVQHAGDVEVGIKSTDANGHLWTLQSSADSGNNSFQIIDRTLNFSRFFIGTNGFVGIGTSNPTNKLHVIGGLSATVFITTSDRNAKENFESVSPTEVLDKVAALPVTRWTFKEMPGQKHLGPMAQDFHSAFGLGADDTGIATVDESGVALAAIQGLNQKVEEKESRIQAQESKIQNQAVEIEILKQDLAELKKMVRSMAGSN